MASRVLPIRYAFGEFELDDRLFELRRAGTPLKLEPKVYDVLAFLIRHRDRVVSKDELLESLWPGEFVSDSVLPRCVAAVRKALGDKRGAATAIATVHGRGYRFVAPVTERAVEPEAVAAPSAEAIGFVGRQEIMARLLAGLDHAAAGRGRLVWITGEPGIGKTRTADVLAAQARLRGAAVLAARCHDGEGAPAYWPWVQVLRSTLRGRDQHEARRAMGQGARDIALLVPELGAAGGAAAAGVSDEARFQLFDSVSSYLCRIAEPAPVVLILDDLHWADGPSLLLLQHLAREMRAARLLVIGTYRDVEVRRHHPLVRILGELAREPHCEPLHLRGLAVDDVARLIAARAGAAVAPGLATAVHQMTEGNPFFVGEIAGLLMAEGRLAPGVELDVGGITLPQSVREAIGRRLDGLSAECNDVLAVAAVLGREFELALLEQVLEPGRGGRASLLALLDEAVAAGLVGVESAALGRYSFAHALVRHTLYEELSTRQRMRLHARIGTALEAARAADLDPVVAEIAHHAFQAAAADPARAVRTALRAAERALRQLAYEDAVSHYERALQVLDLDLSPGADTLLERFEVTLALADALSRAGARLRSEEACRRAAALARSLARPDLLARAALVFGQRESTPLPAQEQRALLEETIAALGEQHPGLRARLLGRMAGIPPYQDSIAMRRELSSRAITLARDAGDQSALLEALAARLWSLLGPDDDAERLQAADELQRLAHPVGDWERVLVAREHRARTFLAYGDLVGSDAETAVYQGLAEERRQPLYLLFSRWYWVARALCDGRLDEAHTLAREAFDRGRRLQHPAALGVLFWHVYWSLRQRGEIERYEEVFRDTLSACGVGPSDAELPPGASSADLSRLVERFNFAGPFVPTTFACVDYALGREAQARREFAALAAHDFADVPRDEWWMATLTHLAELAVALNEDRAVAALRALLQPFAERNASHSLLRTYAGSVAHFLGLLAGAMNDYEDADRLFETAAARNQALGAVPATVMTRYEQARLLFRRGRKLDVRRAAGLVESVLPVAGRSGLGGLQARLRALVAS